MEKAAKQRLASFQKYYAKSPFIHSNFRFSMPGRNFLSSKPLETENFQERVRLQRLKLSLYDECFFFFSFLKNQNFGKADANFLQSRQIDHVCDEVVSGQHWSSEIF